jgi:hypothetical protein
MIYGTVSDQGEPTMTKQFTSIDQEIELDGFTLTATVEADTTMGAPWDEHDGHGSVTDWTTRDKHPGELELCEDRGSRRFYDYREACHLARRDGWGMKGGQLPGETARQYAERAAMHDFNVLRAWANDEWRWVGVVVTATRDGIELGRASLWGIESEDYPGSDGSYLIEVANELTGEALNDATAQLARLCDCVPA